MKKVLFLSIIIISIILCIPVFAEDSFPPAWRGEPGSYNAVFDVWDGFFSGFTCPADSNQSFPYEGQDELGQAWADRPGAGIMGGLHTRTFVLYVVQQGGLVLKIPNFEEPNPQKVIRLQITYYTTIPDVNVPDGFDVWPEFEPVDSPQYFPADITHVNTIQHGTTNWFTSAYDIILEPNPPSESIAIHYIGNELLVDQVIIDTICQRPPQDILPAGKDYWATTEAVLDFGSGTLSDIPPDFFGPGSEPFHGPVPFKTDPPEPNCFADSTIERLEDIDLNDPCTLANIEMKMLSLKSTEPITITYSNGNPNELYNVKLTLHSAASTGQMHIEKIDDNQGVFTYSMNVWFCLSFEPTDGSPASHWVLCEPFVSEMPYPWQKIDPVITVRPPAVDGFYPSGQDELKLIISDGQSYQKLTYKDPLPQDLDRDRDVDFGDLAVFAIKWLVSP